MAGREVVRVLNRCEEALENKQLDLSGCGLASIPVAVFHIMKEVVLETCNISDNNLVKIPRKFSTEFPKITDLNLAHNKLISLPVELNQLSELINADFSSNKLLEFPEGIYGLTNLKKLMLSDNQIAEVDVDRLCNLSLQEVNLRNNPLTPETWLKLSKVTTIAITMDPPKDDLDEMD